MNNGIRKSLIDLKLMRIIHNEKQYLYILKVPSKNHLLITKESNNYTEKTGRYTLTM